MSNQHPLTDDTIRYVKKLGCHDLGTWIYTENDLRAAYDLGREKGHAEMLEAVSRWTKRHAWSYMEQCQYEDDHEFNDSKFIAHLKQALAGEVDEIEDQEDLRLVMERKDSIPIPITLEELSMLPTQEDN